MSPSAAGAAAAAASSVVSRGWGLLEMRPMRMSLEEIFLHVTTEEVPESTAPAAEVIQ